MITKNEIQKDIETAIKFGQGMNWSRLGKSEIQQKKESDFDIDENSGRISEEHREKCSGCSLCEK